MATPVPDKIEFAKRYSDDSGIEFGVSYDRHLDHTNRVCIQFESTSLPLDPDRIPMLVEWLLAVQEVHEYDPAPPRGRSK